jgi:hypothetical protein
LWKSGNRFSTENEAAKLICETLPSSENDQVFSESAARISLKIQASSLQLKGAGPYPMLA